HAADRAADDPRGDPVPATAVARGIGGAMIPLGLLRERPDEVRAAIVARGDDPGLVDRILALDRRRRQLVQEEEALRAERKRGSKGQPLEAAAREALRAMGDRINALARERGEVDGQLGDLLRS